MRPRVGDPMPPFALPSQDGTIVRSEDLLGRGPIVLYFYPRDHTPGCTVEACAFRDRHDDFAALGVTVLGVSPDPVDRHRRFADEHRLPFTLLSDPERRLFRLYGVRSLLGLTPGRETFVMDAGGVVRHHVRSHLFPRRHVDEALAAVRRLSARG